MKQKFAWIGLAFLFVVTSLAFSQDGTPQPCPDVEPGALGCEPVAWSRLQEPMPLPEPDAKPAPPADQQAIIEFSNPDTSTKAEHYWHRRETRGEVRSESERQHDLPTR